MTIPISIPKVKIPASTPVNLVPLTKAANDARLKEIIPTQSANVRDAVRNVKLPENLSEIVEAAPKKSKALFILGGAILAGIGIAVKSKLDGKKENKIDTKA